MKKIKVLGIFRIPVSYINPLLEEFSKIDEIELKVLFCIQPNNENLYPKELNYEFLDGARQAFIGNEHSERDYTIRQKSIKTAIIDYHPDVLFLGTGYLMPTTWIAIKTAKSLGIPIVTRMTTEAVEPGNVIKRLAKRLIVGTYCKKMDAGVYECIVQKNYMLKYGMKEKQLFFAPCSVNNDYFSKLSKNFTKTDAKRILGLDDNCTVIVDTAELIERKRPMDLIRAVEAIKKNYTVKTFFIGKGILKESLQQYIDSNSINECVLCGRLSHEEMSKYLCAADIFVMPSENDASPKALNEAMNFGVAIVVTDGICTANELCQEGVNGFIYHAGNVAELCSCLKKILDNPSVMESMGLVSQKIVSEFSYENVIKGWINAVHYSINH